MTHPTTSDDLVRAQHERDLYRRIDLHQTHTAASFASDVLPSAPLFPVWLEGCACSAGLPCACSPGPRRPRNRAALVSVRVRRFFRAFVRFTLNRSFFE